MSSTTASKPKRSSAKSAKPAETKPAAETTEAAPEAEASPAVPAKAAKAPDAPTVDSASLESDLLAAVREAIGDVEVVDKQSYRRVMHDGNLVVYVRRSKKGLLLQLEARVADKKDVAAATKTVKSAFALR